MTKYTKPLKEDNKEKNYSDELKNKGYEESWGKQEKTKKSNSLSFDVEFDRYDSKGRELEDSDLYPIKTVIPSRNRPKSSSRKDKYSEDYFFKDLDKNEEGEDDEFEKSEESEDNEFEGSEDSEDDKEITR